MPRGFVEVVRPFQIRGWALDDGDLEHGVPVRATIDGEIVGEGVANTFREDLTRVGTGHHGFVLNLRLRLTEDQQARITVAGYSRDGTRFALTRLGPTPAAANVPPQARPAAPAAIVPPPPAQPPEPVPAVPAPAPVTAAPAAAPRAPAPGPAVLRFATFADATEAAHHPVFILGSARPGTSAMAQGLMSASRYEGREEGHLLDIIRPAFAMIEAHYAARGEEWGTNRQTTIADVPARYFEDGFQHLLVVLARQMFPSGYWLDKTPRMEMTLAAPLLQRIWPQAQFIFMKRRAIENIQSRMRKFPMLAFATHCRDWAASMEAWTTVRAHLAGHAIEIDQMTLAQAPDAVVHALAGPLMLQPQEAQRLHTALQQDQPERTAANFGQAESWDRLGWTETQRETFTRTCGRGMAAFGYAASEIYFEPGREGEGVRPIV